MEFVILNPDKERITIRELDKEAAKFWGKEIDPKYYAEPSESQREDEDEVDYARRSMVGNWFDVIGYSIANQGRQCSGWANVVATMIATNLGMLFIDTTNGYKERPVRVAEFEERNNALCLPEKLEQRIYGTLDYYKPYIALINHWQSKGYEPEKIKD